MRRLAQASSARVAVLGVLTTLGEPGRDALRRVAAGDDPSLAELAGRALER